MQLTQAMARSSVIFIDEPSPKRIAQRVVDLVRVDLPALKFDQSDIMVVVPMDKGRAGITDLNRDLQQALNPPSDNTFERTFDDQIFREGDPLMQLSNDYDLRVFMGDVGHLKDIMSQDEALSIEFDGRLVEYPFARSADGLTLAYAASVHKA